MIYLNELRIGENIRQTVYLCKTKQQLVSKQGKSYYSLLLQDKTGTADGKIWDITQGIEHFEAMDYIKIDAMVTEFQGEPQLKITRLQKCSEGEYDPADYIPVSKRNIEEMYGELKGQIASVKNKYLNELLTNCFINDKDFAKKFKEHSAAKNVHHGFMGGLLEHTTSVTRNCSYFAENYPMLNRDLLVTAAMLHDVGKIWELENFPQNDYSDEGQLLGHIYIGANYISGLIDNIQGFPQKLKNELIHCILAHHGELEYGSPKKPALAEALALSMADNLDAKMETMLELFESTDDNGWLGFQRLLDTNIRKTSK